MSQTGGEDDYDMEHGMQDNRKRKATVSEGAEREQIKERNREAQRRCRARNKGMLEELSVKVEALAKQVIQKDTEIANLKELTQELRAQNSGLIKLLRQQPSSGPAPSMSHGEASKQSPSHPQSTPRTFSMPQEHLLHSCVLPPAVVLPAPAGNAYTSATTVHGEHVVVQRATPRVNLAGNASRGSLPGSDGGCTKLALLVAQAQDAVHNMSMSGGGGHGTGNAPGNARAPTRMAIDPGSSESATFGYNHYPTTTFAPVATSTEQQQQQENPVQGITPSSWLHSAQKLAAPSTQAPAGMHQGRSRTGLFDALVAVAPSPSPSSDTSHHTQGHNQKDYGSRDVRKPCDVIGHGASVPVMLYSGAAQHQQGARHYHDASINSMNMVSGGQANHAQYHQQQEPGSGSATYLPSVAVPQHTNPVSMSATPQQQQQQQMVPILTWMPQLVQVGNDGMYILPNQSASNNQVHARVQYPVQPIARQTSMNTVQVNTVSQPQHHLLPQQPVLQVQEPIYLPPDARIIPPMGTAYMANHADSVQMRMMDAGSSSACAPAQQQQQQQPIYILSAAPSAQAGNASMARDEGGAAGSGLPADGRGSSWL